MATVFMFLKFEYKSAFVC